MKLAVVVSEEFRKTLASLLTQKIPLKTAFKLKGIVKTVEEKYAKNEEVRKDALVRFGKKDDKGEVILDDKGNVSFDQEGIQGFIREINELTSTEIEIPKIKVEELGAQVELTVQDLIVLDQVVEE